MGGKGEGKGGKGGGNWEWGTRLSDPSYLVVIFYHINKHMSPIGSCASNYHSYEHL